MFENPQRKKAIGFPFKKPHIYRIFAYNFKRLTRSLKHHEHSRREVPGVTSAAVMPTRETNPCVRSLNGVIFNAYEVPRPTLDDMRENKEGGRASSLPPIK